MAANSSALLQGRDVESGKIQTSGSQGFGALKKASQNFFNDTSGASAITMEWQNLNYAIGDKQILNNVSGLIDLKAGGLTCVLGPSGSGKSTLMNVLAGRQKLSGNGMAFSGTVTASGVPIEPVNFRSNIAYVMQDDALLATETPKECLRFSSKMRLPKSIPMSEKESFVDELLKALGLEKSQDTVVGNALLKGISGGERKRTSVGVELITNPKLLFLDEPLSGLDSFAAHTLVTALKQLAADGTPVLCTVHQPSSEIFEMFDNVILLHDGEVVYNGPNDKISEYFDQRGFPCRKNFNPADHIMFLIQTEPADAVQKLKEEWQSSDLQTALLTRIAKNRQAEGTARTPSFIHSGKAQASACAQFSELFAREMRGVVRNKGPLAARFGMTIFLSIMYGWLFAGSCSKGDKSGGPCTGSRQSVSFDAQACQTNFQAHLGSVLSLSIAAMMGAAQPTILTFPSERPVFLREYAAKQYGVIQYFVSKSIVELPVVFLTSVVMFLVTYWLMGFHGNFLYLCIYSWLLGITSSGLSMIVGSGVASVEKAIQLAPLTLLPQMLFSGLFIPVDQIPDSLKWVRYACPLKYAINLMAGAEFHYVKQQLDDGCTPDQCPGAYARKAGLEAQSIYWDDWAIDLGALIALYFVFRVMACFVLWRKGRYVF